MRIAVIADIHANLEAFEAVIADWGEVDEVWCLGDVVGYGPDPNGCLDRLRAFPRFVCVPGNHDYAAIGQLGEETFNPVARAALEWTAEQLRPEHRDYLRGLDLVVVRGEMTITHGSPRNPVWEYLLTAAQAHACFAHFSTPCCLVGHTHVPMIFAEEGPDSERPRYAEPGMTVVVGTPRLIINPGSVGQPRDRDPRAAYAVYDPDSRRVEFRRVAYSIASTQRRMRRAGLPEPLAVRLAVGW
ncbi:MAG: metallophosphoesterase family protein [Chloroflexi bacterium]|nr:metallophosphoesterase family protein [Chloroflexota bacterium]